MDEALGEHVATHRYSTADEQRRLLQWLGICGAGALLAAASFPFGLVLVVGGILAVATTLIEMAIRHARDGGGTIERYDRGLRIALRGRAPRMVGFEDVGAIVSDRGRFDVLDRKPTGAVLISPWFAFTADRKPKDVWRHRVRLGDDELSLDRHWTDVHELMNALVAARAKVLLPEAKRALEAGKEVSFGRVSITPDGVRVASRTLPWAELADVTIQQAQVVVRRKPAGRFAAIDTREVPDTNVLLQLARFVPEQRHSYR